VNRFTWQTLLTVNRKHFFMNILYIESFCHIKCTIERCSSIVHPQAPASKHAHARLLPRLSGSWIVLLLSDICI
jgi:hypothetical protein